MHLPAMTAKRQNRFEPDYAIPPGATLEETMETLGMTQRDLAHRTGLTVQTLNRIFKGEQPITYETANKLELVTGVPAGFWNNLEAQYREQLAKIEQNHEMEAHLDWLKIVPIKELIARKAILPSDDKVILLREAFRFYGVSSVDAWRAVWERPAAAARRSTFFESNPGATSAWLRLGQLKAREIDCRHYDKKLFADALASIRALTVSNPSVFIPEMRRLCAQAGVAFVLVPEIKGAPWSGAAEWLTSTKAMILLNLRGKAEDRFWFTFFHEASHILNDSKKDIFIDDGRTYADDPAEMRADDFASETLIPRKHDPAIRTARSVSDIIALAQQLGVSTGVVAGRFRHITKKWTHFNALIQRLEWEVQQP
jgi:HTH-type transcriptional regulator/antitoxin HigA